MHLRVIASPARAFHPGMEAEYMADVAKQRRPVLMCVFVFDIAIYLFRLGFHGVDSAQDFTSRAGTILPQIINMIALHSIVGWVNWRSRRSSNHPIRDEVCNPRFAMSTTENLQLWHFLGTQRLQSPLQTIVSFDLLHQAAKCY